MPEPGGVQLMSLSEVSVACLQCLLPLWSGCCLAVRNWSSHYLVEVSAGHRGYASLVVRQSCQNIHSNVC